MRFDAAGRRRELRDWLRLRVIAWFEPVTVG
jgi:hypothetical protein